MKDNFGNFDDIFDFIERMMRTEMAIDSDFSGGIKFNTSFSKPVEISENKDNIYITASLGNITEKDIIILIEPELVHFQITTDEGEYVRSLSLPSIVKKKKLSKTFNTTTGILDIVLEKEKHK